MGRSQYRTKEDVKSIFMDLKWKVEHFQCIHNELENAHLNKDEVIILQTEIYRLVAKGRDFTHGNACNVLKNVPLFSIYMLLNLVCM